MVDSLSALSRAMDFQSAMETFAEAWVAANVTQTQALALTRPKTPKKEQSGSPPSTNSRQHSECNLRSPINEARSSSKTPSMHNNDHNSGDVNSPILNAKIPQSPIPSSEKLNHHPSDNSHNNNGVNSSQREQQHREQQQFPPHALNGPEKILPSPSVERKDFDFSKVNAKSLPLHCVVESVPSLQASFQVDARSPWRRRPNIEMDSYVIVPGSTPFCDIVTIALQRLGYSSDISNTAKGAIIIKNWKPLPLDKITDNTLISVSEILGELTSSVTLKITIIRTKPTQLAEIKDKLLKLLILQSHTVLRSSGCPLDEITLSQICRSPLQNNFPFPEISEEIRRKFDQWWASQLTPQANPIAHKILPFINPQAADLDFATTNLHHNLQQQREALIAENHHPTHSSMMVHPALQTVHTQYPNQKTRMRTSFDPEMELPKLQRWFQENPHPSRQQIQTYVVQLNSLESRRGRKPLDVNNVVYWFKNARAAQKRAETNRGIHNLSNGYSTPSGLMMGHHGDYMKSSPSAPSDDIDNISQHSDDDDDDDRPMSPQLPLQLTVHERNRSMSPPNIECETRIKLEDEKTMSPPLRQQKLDDGDKNRNESGNSKMDESNENSGSNNNNNNNNDDSIKSNNSMDHSSNSPQPRSPSPSEDLDIDDQEQMDEYRSPSPMDPKSRDLLLPAMMNPNSMFSAHSIMYMSHYIPAMQNAHAQSMHAQSPGLNPSGLNLSNSFSSSDERRKRNRTFIDPVTEVPKLEQWFSMNTHPSHNMILKYTEDLNRMPYRQKFPRLESKNVQFWFKNRRAKCKRLKMSLYDSPSQLSGLNPFHSSSDRE